jgi:chromosomal replication initiator protein
LSIDSPVATVSPDTTQTSALISSISLDRPAFLRKHLPDCAQAWPCTDYFIGPENAGLVFLFRETTISSLGSFSPVVIYGEKDLGTTDLAITLAVRWSKLVRQKPIYLTTGANFCRDYANALEIGDIATFRNRLAACKMLIIESLEPVIDKPSVQQELTAAIDTLAALGRPLLFTSCSLPASLAGISPRLASRLSAGFSYGLSNPGSEARAALLAALAAVHDGGLPLPELTALADELSCDQPLSPSTLIRLVKMAHQSRMDNGQVPISTLRALIKQLQRDEAPDIHVIAKTVSRKMRVKLSDVRGNSRISRIVRARGLAIFLTRQLSDLSLHQIGLYFGGRDHSTVLHACRKTFDTMSDDPELANLCRDIQSELFESSG